MKPDLSMLLLSVAGLTLGSSTAAAQPAPGPPANAGPEVVVTRELPDAQKRVCKSSVATGSIIPARVCRTKQEWEDIRERSIATLDQMRSDQKTRDHTANCRLYCGAD